MQRPSAHIGTHSGTRFGIRSRMYAGIFGRRIFGRIHAAIRSGLQFVTQPPCFASTFDLPWHDEASTAHRRLRMVAWSVSLSSILWCGLIFAGRELWKIWR
jgi:hypothetical protein